MSIQLWNCHYNQDVDHFESLTQLLVKMDAMLEENQAPQSYTSHRTFSAMVQPEAAVGYDTGVHKGSLATFEVQILFRQHTSWQGTVIWQEKKMEQSFRSALELILLMDSALRDLEGRDAG